MNPFALLFGPVIEAIGGAVNHYFEVKKIERQGELDLKKAELEGQIKAASAVEQHSADWEVASIQNSGWKDEWITIILSIPLIGSFVPGLDIYIHRGFAVLSETPEWYRYSIMVMIAAAFGYQKLANWFGKKNGNGG